MNTNYNFTTKDVLHEVLKLAQERPDFVYLDQPGTIKSDHGFAACSYVGAAGRTGKGVGEGCIVGQALQRLGVSTAVLLRYEGQGAGDVVKRLSYAHNESSLERLRAIQVHQDRGMPWGEAVAREVAV